MTCDDNDQCSISKVQIKITKQEQSEHRPLKRIRGRIKCHMNL